MQWTRFSEREPWPSSDHIVRLSDLSLTFLAFLTLLALLTPVLAQHHRLSRRRRLKSTTMDNVFKEKSEHLFLSCSPTVPVFHLMVKLFNHSCAKYSGYVNVFRPVVSGLALRKANGDETVQWPPRRFARQNEPSPPPSPLPPPPSPKWPSAGRTTSAGAAGECC